MAAPLGCHSYTKDPPKVLNDAGAELKAIVCKKMRKAELGCPFSPLEGGPLAGVTYDCAGAKASILVTANLHAKYASRIRLKLNSSIVF